MQLLLFRHGIAEPPEEADSDASRALTPRGADRTLLAAHGLARVTDRPQAILTSPKTRALQTAAIAAEVFDMAPEPVDVLADGDPRRVLAMLRRRAEASVMLIGHEPWMSELIETLCMPKAPHGFLELKKAGAALVDAPIRLDEPPGTGVLRWLIPPRVLRSLAGGH